MVGMVSQFGAGRYATTISSRTIQSGGSVGGNKKPGTVNYGTSWPRGNMGNFLARADRGCCPQKKTIAYALTHTTRNPVQQNRNGYSVTHSGNLG